VIGIGIAAALLAASVLYWWFAVRHFSSAGS
jgi:hypothetical protein